VVKVTVDSRFKNTTLHKWIKHMHHESVIKCRIAVAIHDKRKVHK